MSTSVGISFASDDTEIRDALLALLGRANVGYGLGSEHFELDVREGVVSFVGAHELNTVIALRSPPDLEINLAPEIERELTNLETSKVAPRFFTLLSELAALLFQSSQKSFFVFFASEWEPDEEVRFGYGHVDDLISILSAPGHWCLRLIDTRSKRQHNSDRYPFVFEVMSP